MLVIFLFTSLDWSNRSVASDSDICEESTMPAFLESPMSPQGNVTVNEVLVRCKPVYARAYRSLCTLQSARPVRSPPDPLGYDSLPRTESQR